MTLGRRHRWIAPPLAAALCIGACKDSTQPPKPAVQLLQTAGDGQSWYFNNPLPATLSVEAVDSDGNPVSGVVVTWAVASGGGGVSPLQSTTDAGGMASTADSIGSATIQTVSASSVALLGPVSFTEHATTPPTSGAVTLNDNFFTPNSLVIQSGDSVTWTWSGANTHNLTFTAGHAPLPMNQGNQNSGSTARGFTTVGTYSYHCTNHAGMTGSVTVVH